MLLLRPDPPARLGRRGSVLLILGTLDLLYGISLLEQAPVVFTPGHEPVIPVTVWAWLWIASAIVCYTGAWRKHDRWHFAFSAAIKMGWAAEFIHLWDLGVPRAWVSAVIWVALDLILLIVASWPDVPVTPVEVPDSHDHV